MNVRIGIITTLNTNIGDDFIRTGLCKVLEAVYKGRAVEFIPINKHEPCTVYGAYHPVRLAGLAKHLPRGKERARKLIEACLATPAFSRFEHCDAIVQSGAPVIWPGCHGCEWAEPLWHQVVGRLHKRIPVLNLAAGSAFSWERQPEAITDPADAAYLRAIHGYCRLTTARDSLTQLLFRSLGCDVPLIPCSALLAAGGAIGPERSSGDLILINYMPGGGHYDFDQRIDGQVWRETVQTLIASLGKRHKLAFLCHNKKEHRIALELAEGLPCFLPKSVPEYFEMAAQAKFGIFNRMHASVALAGMGIPSVAIGTDTRLLMVKRLGLPFFPVKEASVQALESTVESLLLRRGEEEERLLALREETWQSYLRQVAPALGLQ